MVPWQLTLLEFMGGKTEGQGSQMNPFEVLMASTNPPGWILGTESFLPDRDDFATAIANRAGATPADQVLLTRTLDSWKLIGGYIDSILAIDDTFQGLGLSTELILRACEHRPVPTERLMTVPGYKALAKAHRVAVERAVAAGLDVPTRVRADYNL